MNIINRWSDNAMVAFIIMSVLSFGFLIATIIMLIRYAPC